MWFNVIRKLSIWLLDDGKCGFVSLRGIDEARRGFYDLHLWFWKTRCRRLGGDDRYRSRGHLWVGI